MRKHWLYLKYVLRHKLYVGLECWRYGLWWQGLVHDWQKLTPTEWSPYVESFYGAVPYSERPPALVAAFNQAWLHHIHHGKHHPEHWLLYRQKQNALCVTSGDLLAEIDKLTGRHFSFGAIDVNRNPLQVSDVVRVNSTAPGGDVIQTGVNAGEQLFAGDGAPVILLLKQFEQDFTKSFVVASAGLPDSDSPVQQTVIDTVNRCFTTAHTQAAFFSAIPSNLVAGAHLTSCGGFSFGDIKPSSLASSFVEPTELLDLANRHVEISTGDAQVISLTLDAMIAASKLLGKQRRTLCFVVFPQQIFFAFSPLGDDTLCHGFISHPELYLSISNTGYYSEDIYKWQDWQYWVLREDDGETFPLAMPHRYWQEMICDWIGAGRALGKYDPIDHYGEVRQWYLRNRGKILLHPDTRALVECELGINCG